MVIVIVEAIAPVASWRPPEALTYHRTLPLPPYTTLVGMLGAAMGLDLPSIYRHVAEHNLRLGVGGWHDGHARDLWKFQKLELRDEGKEMNTDIVLREYWIDTRLVLVVETQDAQTAEHVADAFRRPAFPLTAGPSDALMKVVAVRVEKAKPIDERRLAHVLVPRELTPRYGLFEELAKIPLSRGIRAPSVERLPTGFAFEPDVPRRLLGRALVTFVADPIVLAEGEEPVSGYRVEPQSTFLARSPKYLLWKDQFPWIIPVHRYDSTPPEEISSTPPLPSPKTPRKGRSDKPTESM